VSGVDTGAVPKPLNDKPLETASFTDPRVEFGTERCFVVRTVQQQGGAITESEPSQPACVTPVDSFPPEAPKGLAAVASDGAISLIWEASAAADLAGYVIMRSEPGGAPHAITPEPIKETTFRDTTASRGAKYLYTVVAVDTAGNRSAPSNAVEETAR
jgi:fibronectin type 3 domain-containing protein